MNATIIPKEIKPAKLSPKVIIRSNPDGGSKFFFQLFEGSTVTGAQQGMLEFTNCHPGGQTPPFLSIPDHVAEPFMQAFMDAMYEKGIRPAAVGGIETRFDAFCKDISAQYKHLAALIELATPKKVIRDTNTGNGGEDHNAKKDDGPMDSEHL